MTEPEPERRRSPLHEVHASEGATFTDFAGWTMPLKYGSELAEHTAVRTAAGLFDLSHMAEIVVLGPEAGHALDAGLLGELAGVLQRHGPTGEVGEGGAFGGVHLVERRTAAFGFAVFTIGHGRRLSQRRWRRTRRPVPLCRCA